MYIVIERQRNKKKIRFVFQTVFTLIVLTETWREIEKGQKNKNHLKGVDI